MFGQCQIAQISSITCLRNVRLRKSVVLHVWAIPDCASSMHQKILSLDIYLSMTSRSQRKRASRNREAREVARETQEEIDPSASIEEVISPQNEISNTPVATERRIDRISDEDLAHARLSNNTVILLLLNRLHLRLQIN